jgi:hypothetical protein
MFVGLSLSKHENSQQFQHNFLPVRLFLQTSKLGFEIAPSLLQCLALTVIVKSAGGSVYSRLQQALCTAVNGSDFINYKADRLFYLW